MVYSSALLTVFLAVCSKGSSVPATLLTVYGHLPGPHQVYLVAHHDDGLGVEVSTLPEALQQLLGLPGKVRIGKV